MTKTVSIDKDMIKNVHIEEREGKFYLVFELQQEDVERWKESLNPSSFCDFLDENNQCSNDDIPQLECLERQGYNCYEKRIRGIKL